MPELPEVETIRRGVAGHVLGRTITSITVHRDRAARHDAWDGQGEAPPSYRLLAGRTITEVARRGKFLWLGLQGAEDALACHLGMSGQLLHHASPEVPPPSHLAATIALDDGSRLLFRDQRTFGWVRHAELLPTADSAPGGEGTDRALVPEPAAHIARDPLDPHLDRDAAIARLLASGSAIKRLLLDQRVISGIGNIYADEALFAARLHPLRPGNSLTRGEATSVVSAAAAVMARAIEAGGTSFDALYVNTAGEAGYFSRELRAYGRRGLPCTRCGRIMKSLVVGGRTSHLCSQCQPE